MMSLEEKREGWKGFGSTCSAPLSGMMMMLMMMMGETNKGERERERKRSTKVPFFTIHQVQLSLIMCICVCAWVSACVCRCDIQITNNPSSFFLMYARKSVQNLNIGNKRVTSRTYPWKTIYHVRVVDVMRIHVGNSRGRGTLILFLHSLWSSGMIFQYL